MQTISCAGLKQSLVMAVETPKGSKQKDGQCVEHENDAVSTNNLAAQSMHISCAESSIKHCGIGK